MRKYIIGVIICLLIALLTIQTRKHQIPEKPAQKAEFSQDLNLSLILSKPLISDKISSFLSVYARVVDLLATLAIYILILLLYKQFSNLQILTAFTICLMSCDIYGYLALNESAANLLKSLDLITSNKSLLLANDAAIPLGYVAFYGITLTYIAACHRNHKNYVNILCGFGIMLLFMILATADIINENYQGAIINGYHNILSCAYIILISTIIKPSFISRVRNIVNYYKALLRYNISVLVYGFSGNFVDKRNL